MLLVDDIARTATAAEIPVGILTSLIGVRFLPSSCGVCRAGAERVIVTDLGHAPGTSLPGTDG
ncbi:hypothetical protein [Rhizobium sp. CG5]|uniref:hypothetical protein n=1 Tax=Rhizobium sp. CG5 TaxID=2726076 RepID=UPI002033E05C|nr:hypothetical protein [Rhizobium sp. CG5]